MADSAREYGLVDELIAGFDGWLKRRPRKAVTAPLRAGGRKPPAGRPSPAESLPEAPLSAAEKRHAAGLMRVNHSGEVCAQALYNGQAAVARQPQLREALLAAGAEERDHLHWCRTRLHELGEKPSILDPGWWAGSLVIGMIAGAAGDRLSLGFIEETERQVCAHLDGHLEALPAGDAKSRAIVAAMRADEAAHAARARSAGSGELPPFVKRLMALQARVMTSTAYWI